MVGISQERVVEWQNHRDVSGVDFGSQIFQRSYEVEKVATGSGSPHLILYKPDISQSTFESLKPLLKLGKEIIKWKYIIFLFNTPNLKNAVSAVWRSRVSLRNIKHMLELLEHCEFKRAKVRKDGMTVYLYAVKKKNEEFVLHDEWNRLLSFVREREGIF